MVTVMTAQLVVPDASAVKHSARRWWALVAIAASVLVVGLDLTVLNLALPTLAVSLHASTGDLQWIADSYSLVLAAPYVSPVLPPGAVPAIGPGVIPADKVFGKEYSHDLDHDLMGVLDPEKIVASIRDGQEELLTAGRTTMIEAAEAMEQTLGMFADADDKLAEATEVEWMSRALRARASFTRDMLGASSRFTRELLTP